MCKEADHPVLLERGTGDRVHMFKQQQKTALLLFQYFYVFPLDFLLCQIKPGHPDPAETTQD